MENNQKSSISYYNPNTWLILFIIIGGGLLAYHMYTLWKEKPEKKTFNWGHVETVGPEPEKEHLPPEQPLSYEYLAVDEGQYKKQDSEYYQIPPPHNIELLPKTGPDPTNWNPVSEPVSTDHGHYDTGIVGDPRDTDPYADSTPLDALIQKTPMSQFVPAIVQDLAY